MKYLLVMGLALVVFWLWRHNRQTTRNEALKAAPPPKTSAKRLAPVNIVACPVCGVHLPQTDALPGPGGHYCCDAHRRQAGG